MKREQRIADAKLQGLSPYGERVKKVKLSDEFLYRKVCPSIEAAVTAAGLAAQYWNDESGRWEKKAESAAKG